MKVIIVGGGIAGLTLSLSLKHFGLKSVIYEAASEIKPLGAGIVIAMNGLQVFDRLGLNAEILAASCPLKSMRIVDENFNLISDQSLQSLQKQFGHLNRGIHRADLHRVLMRNLTEGSLQLNKKFVKFEEHPKGVSVFFEDGEIVEGDILIGADGLHSRVRNQMFPDHPERYSGQTSWRGVLNYTLPSEYAESGIESWGKDLRFGIVNLPENKAYWFAVSGAAMGEKDHPLSLREDLQKRFSDFKGPVQDLLQNTPIEQIIRLDIKDIPLLKKWSTRRVCLIGDAAHATTPNLGQGGNQAIEDGFSLAQVLKEQGTQDAKIAFEKFFQLRQEKVSFVVNSSWQMGKVAHLKSGFLIALRNFVMKHAPSSTQERMQERIYKLNF